MRRQIVVGLCLMLVTGNCFAAIQAPDFELWKATAYDSCKVCCGKTDGITASGKKAHKGTVACNWLPFGTKLLVNGQIYTVEDRGAKSLFGDKHNHIRHIDLWMPTHKEARRYGVHTVKVTILSVPRA